MASKSSKVKGKHQGKSSKPTPNQYGEKNEFLVFLRNALILEWLFSYWKKSSKMASKNSRNPSDML